MHKLNQIAILAATSLALAVSGSARAENGVTDTEVVFGHTAPYSGPASAYGTTGRALVAYMQMINEKGGIAGRQIKILSRDDQYSPPKAVELTRQLVERDGVVAMVSVIGAANNMATRGYLNERKVPQLFVATGASEVASHPDKFPFTVGWVPAYKTEAMVIGRHILETVEDPRVAIIAPNDDLGKDYINGLKAGLGDKADSVIVGTQIYETGAPSVNSDIITLQGTGANVLVNFATPKFAAQAIKKAGELGWKPAQYITLASSSAQAVLAPAGLEYAQGIISFQFIKDPTDPKWADDEGFLAYKEFMAKYMPDVPLKDATATLGYNHGETLHRLLEIVGRDLTRESLLKAATNLKDVQLSMFQPGITLNTSPTDHLPVSCLQMAVFSGESWNTSGDLVCEDE